MARFSPPFLNVLKKKRPGSGETPAPLEENRMTLYLLVRVRRSLRHGYVHDYEVCVVQSGADFLVEMRSQLGSEYNWGNASQFHRYGPPWRYQKKFELLDQAWQHAQEILKDPRRFSQSNRPVTWWSSHLDEENGAGKIVSKYELSRELENGRLAESVASGKTPMPGGLEAGEIMRQLWGRNENAARAAIIEYAKKAPLTYGHWSHWKWLYKQAEAQFDLEILEVMLKRLDGLRAGENTRKIFFSWTQQEPSSRTIDYMKRRARRFMRDLAEIDPASYIELAYRILAQPLTKEPQLDLRNQWVTLDILYGHSKRFEQSGHSRGAYFRRQKRPSLLLEDGRAGQAWRKRPDLLLKLYSDPELPWQTLEGALKLLLAGQIPRPELSRPILWRFLQSDSVLLVREAARQIAVSSQPRQIASGMMVAVAFMKSNGAIRKKLAEYLQFAKPMPEWDRNFATELAKLVANHLSGTKFSRRQMDAARLLARRYIEELDYKGITSLIPALLATRQFEFFQLLETFIAKTPSSGLVHLLEICEPLAEEPRQTLIRFILNSQESRQFELPAVHNLIFASSAWVRETGWQILAAARVNPRHIADRWDMLFWPGTPPYVLASAVASEAAIGLLIKTSRDLETLVSRFTTHPILLTNITVKSFAPLLKTFPLAAIVKLVGTMEDSLWQNLRERLIDHLREDGRLGPFWQQVWKVISEDPSRQLIQRLLNDHFVSQTFNEVAEPTFLELPAEPLFGPLLVSWLEANAAHFRQGARPLLTAAMHPLPEVREWALAHLDRVGLTTLFALRLLESGLPQPIAKAKEYFESVTAYDPRELEYCLVICDSPDRNAQAYGREYLQKRLARLPLAQLVGKLAEHPDPFIQEMVANILVEKPHVENEPKVAEFDAAVLRARDKGRRAKELVKKRFNQPRISSTAPNLKENSQRPSRPDLDPGLLIEMARGRTPRDAEWAWQQLVQLALAGEKIEGFEVHKVEGV